MNSKNNVVKKMKDGASNKDAQMKRTGGIPQATAREGTLVEFFARSPLRGSGLKIERIRDGFRAVEFD